MLDDELLDEPPPEEELLELGELLDEEGPDELLDETPLDEELEYELDDEELLQPPEDELLEEEPPELDEEGPDELLDETPLDEELEYELDDDELNGSPEEELLGDEELLELIDRYSRNVEGIQLRPVLRHKGVMSSAKADGGGWISLKTAFRMNHDRADSIAHVESMSSEE